MDPLDHPMGGRSSVTSRRWGAHRDRDERGRTTWNQMVRHLPKSHWLDAAGVGASTSEMLQMCRTNAPHQCAWVLG
jgi:hypothetical protein